MHWNLGGNFAPVQMICQIDWRQCPSAFANYIWCEAVTDVLDFLARGGMAWRVPAILVIGFFILRMMWKKRRNCTTMAIPDKEMIHQVGSKVQDLELKINVLTYKLQYGTWPLPHEIQGTLVKRAGHNVRLSLSGPNNHVDWMHNLSLRRNHPSVTHSTCNPRIASQLGHLINWQNGKPQHHMQRGVLPIKYNGAKHSNSSSDRSLDYNSERPRKHSSNLGGINKLSKSEDLQMYHGTMHQFLSNPRRHNGRLTYKERISRDLSFYRRCCEFQAYERFTKTLEECKSFLRELNNSNKNLGFVISSSDLTVSSNTDTGLEIHLGKNRKKRKKWNKNLQYSETCLRKPFEIVENQGTLKSTQNDKTIMKTSSITNLTDQKLLAPSANLPVTLRGNEVEQSSEQTLHDVRKRLESLYNVLRNLNIQDPTLGEMGGRSLSDKLRETFQNSTETFEYITGEIKYLCDGPLEESRMDIMTSNQSLNYVEALDSNFSTELKDQQHQVVSNIYSTEPSRTIEDIQKCSSTDFKNTSENSESRKKPIVMEEAVPTPVDTEDDATVVSWNSSNFDVYEAMTEDMDRMNLMENAEKNPSFALVPSMSSSMGHNQQLTFLDIIAEEQSTGSSSERASACPSHLRMNKQVINNEEDHLGCDEPMHAKSPNEKSYTRDETLATSGNNSKEHFFKADDVQTLEVNTDNYENDSGVALDIQNNCSNLYLKRYPGLCSLVEKQLGVDDVRDVDRLKSSSPEACVKTLEIYDTVDSNVLQMPDAIGSSANCRNFSSTTVELKHSTVSSYENKTELVDGDTEYTHGRCSELEHFLSVNKWCLDQQEHNTTYNIECSPKPDQHSSCEAVNFKEESSSLNTTPASSLPGGTKQPEKLKAKGKTIKKSKIDTNRPENKSSKVDTVNNKRKLATSPNFRRSQVQSKEKMEIQSIGSNTNTNTTDLTSLGRANTSEEDLRRSITRPAASRINKNSPKHNPESLKHVKQSTLTGSIKSPNTPALRNTKAKVRSNLTCARIRCSSAEPESNRNPGRSLQPKRSRSQDTEHRSETKIQQLPVESKIHTNSPPQSITWTPKMFSKSNIPVLRSRVEVTRRTESEITPRTQVQEPLPTSMSWKDNGPSKNSGVKHELMGIEKNVQCMGEVKHPLLKKNKVLDCSNKDTRIQLRAEANEINPRGSSVIDSHSQAEIYVKIFTQDYKSMTGLINPNKFLEYIKGKEGYFQGMLARSQSATPRNKKAKVLSLVTNTQDRDAYKILSTTSAVKHKTLNNACEMPMNVIPLENPPPPSTLPNLYFLSIEQKDMSSLEISLSIQNLQQLSESSENVLKKKELNNDEHETLINVLHKAQNHLYLQEVYNLCKEIISRHQNLS